MERQALVSVSPPNPELAALRQAIDGIDDALGGLLATRVCLSHQAQALKSRAGLPVLDRAREDQIQHSYERHWRGAGAVARAILGLCRED